MLLDKQTIFGELYATYRKRVKQKHLTKESYEFSRMVGVLLEDAAVRIKNHTWTVIGYFPFHVYHPHRIINAPYYADRVVEQWYVERFIIPAFKDVIMEYNMSCQEEKGPMKNMDITKAAMEEMYYMFGTDWYVNQFDCEGYFDNISHEFAINFIGSRIDPDWLWLYEVVVDSYDAPDGYAMMEDPLHRYGFPKGNLPSQWTGIIALNGLDHDIADDPRCWHSSRYMDDGIGFYHEKGDAKHARHMIEKWLSDNEVGVRVHPKKSAYFPISRGFTYCGWTYSMDEDGTLHVRIKNGKKKEQEHRLKMISEGVKDGTISIFDARRTQEGMFEYLSHGTESEALINYLYRTYPIP